MRADFILHTLVGGEKLPFCFKKAAPKFGTAFFIGNRELLSSLLGLDGLDELGHDLEQVAHDTVVSHLKDGSGLSST